MDLSSRLNLIAENKLKTPSHLNSCIAHINTSVSSIYLTVKDHYKTVLSLDATAAHAPY